MGLTVKERRTRQELFRKRPFCYWCGCRVIPPKKCLADERRYMATLDHRYGFLDERRHKRATRKDPHVLACKKCNEERGELDRTATGPDLVRAHAKWQQAKAAEQEK